MNSGEYLNSFVKSIEKNFNIEYDKTIFDMHFDMTAVFNQRSARYLVIKSAEIYAFKNDEYIFCKIVKGKLEQKHLNELKNFISKNVNDIVKIDKEHMSSVVTFIICSDEIADEKVKASIKKFKFYKSFSLGFKGWVNTKLIFINPNNELVITNKFAKGSEKLLFPKVK